MSLDGREVEPEWTAVLVVGCLLHRVVCAWCCVLAPIPALMEKSVADQEAAVEIPCQSRNSGDMMKEPFSPSLSLWL